MTAKGSAHPATAAGTRSSDAGNVPSAAGGRSSARRIIPPSFLGIGVYRAWIEITFVGSFVPFPVASGAVVSVRDWFDIVGVAVMVACVLIARKAGPFYRHKAVFWICGASMLLSTAMVFATVAEASLASALSMPAAILGGVGMGLIILIWSEVYGCLDPLRVTLYYSASLAAGALIVYTFMGFRAPWLAVFTVLLPVVALVSARRSMQSIPEAARPRKETLRFTAPGKIFLLMALYGFAYGIIETRAYSGFFGPHSSPGCLVVALIIVAFVSQRRERFDFNVIVRIALPLMIVAFWLVPMLGLDTTALSGLCAVGGYTAASVLIMALCSNMCFRHGVSAIWLFGIERSLRLVFMFLGRATASVAAGVGVSGINSEMLVSGLAVVTVVMATVVLLSQRNVDGQWGVSFLNGSSRNREEKARQALAWRCEQLGKSRGLTGREIEILTLLAQHKTVGMIERQLVIANGTAKAHVRHIYQKLGIHSREELFELLESRADPIAEGEAAL